MRAYVWFLDRAKDGGIELTSAGYLKPTDVDAASRVVPAMGDWIGKNNRESLAAPLLDFRQSLQAIGLLRKYNRSTVWASSPSPAPRSDSPVAGTSHRTGTRAHRRSNSCGWCWPMRDRIATMGPIAAVAGAFGLCCDRPLLLSMGVVGAVAGWSRRAGP